MVPKTWAESLHPVLANEGDWLEAEKPPMAQQNSTKMVFVLEKQVARLK